ncbi:MAG: hypothetical protein Unbinned1446contig1001_26 [Prokaryotic dsDNA virus sp.]|nr:MAG: hypothetical protein Unbinned1446contig1001_26 [Prokaryotic dsDNA virus sp.]
MPKAPPGGRGAKYRPSRGASGRQQESRSRVGKAGRSMSSSRGNKNLQILGDKKKKKKKGERK